jgi:hypothetical protein
MNILQFADGLKRLICRDEMATSLIPNNVDGLSKITNLKFSIYDDTHMIDVFEFETYIPYSQLNFEEETLDKLTKIHVSPSNAVRNIKQLNDNYTLDMNNNVISIHNKSPFNSSLLPPQIPNMMNRSFDSKMMNHTIQNAPMHVKVPVHRPVPNTTVPLLGHRRFGMRGLFM